MTALATIGSFALAYAGMSGLALAMDRHHRQLRQTADSPGAIIRRAWRLAGWALLALSLWLSLHTWGAAVGAAAWFGVVSAVTLALVLVLPYAPALAWQAAWAAAPLGLVAIVAQL